MSNIDNFIGLKFEGLKRNHGRGTADIHISKSSTEKYTITFRNGSKELIDGERLMFAIHNDCLIFKGGPEGYKFYTNSAPEKPKLTNFYVRICPNEPEKFDAFVGDYALKYEKLLGLYYIQRSGGTENA